MSVSDPLDIDGGAVGEIIENFATTVIDKIAETQAKYAFLGMDEKSQEVMFDDEVKLRRISGEELWEYGSVGSIYTPASDYISGFMSPIDILSENWMILEISKTHGLEEHVEVMIKKDAALMNMLMSARGKFRVIDLGIKRKSWFSGTTHIGDRYDRYLSVHGAEPFLLDEPRKTRMVGVWGHILKIIETDNFLKLPADRLIDGSSRRDLKDSVIDYAIGLEALLTLDAQPNMSYRFALRGAQIINWDGGNKTEWYQKLKVFYEVRNIIVHGRLVPRKELIACAEVGEIALREIWWWYVVNGIDDIRKGTEMVEAKILE